MVIASSSVSNGIIARTGPKISSLTNPHFGLCIREQCQLHNLALFEAARLTWATNEKVGTLLNPSINKSLHPIELYLAKQRPPVITFSI